MTGLVLEPRARRRLRLQKGGVRALSPLTLPVVWATLRIVLGYRIEALAEHRAVFRRIWRESDAPLLICANHLTMIDSFLIGWALGSPWFYLREPAAMAWNVPERRNFGTTLLMRVAIYLLKCVPIERGGRRRDVASVLASLAWLLSRGDTALIFPEGGRSRSGRVETDAAAVGVGRVIRAVPGCRVLCVYLRGERQEGHTTLPARGDRFRVALSLLEPKAEARGLRGSLEVARQVVARLAEMEREHFRARE